MVSNARSRFGVVMSSQACIAGFALTLDPLLIAPWVLCLWACRFALLAAVTRIYTRIRMLRFRIIEGINLQSSSEHMIRAFFLTQFILLVRTNHLKMKVWIHKLYHLTPIMTLHSNHSWTMYLSLERNLTYYLANLILSIYTSFDNALITHNIYISS